MKQILPPATVARLRLLLTTAGLQGLVQALGFVAGLCVIRALDPTEYAYYTIAYTTLSTLLVIADGGLCAGVLAEVGPRWKDRVEVGTVINTALALRQRLAMLVLLVGLPVTVLLCYRQGASLLHSCALAAVLLPLFHSAMTTSLLETVPRLHQQVVPLQGLQAAGNAARAMLTVLATCISPLALTALLAAALPQAWAAWRTRRLAAPHADLDAPAVVEVRARMRALLARTLPAAAYYAFSGHLTVWLLSYLADTADVAALGALGRLTMLTVVIGNVFAVIAIPRFARLPDTSPGRLHRRYWQAQGVLAAAVSMPALIAALAPVQVLSLLGAAYGQWQGALLWMAVAAAGSAMAGAAYSLGAVRGVVAPAGFAIPASVAVQAGLVVALPVHTLDGVAQLACFAALAQWLLHTAHYEWKRVRTLTPATGSFPR